MKKILFILVVVMFLFGCDSNDNSNHENNVNNNDNNNNNNENTGNNEEIKINPAAPTLVLDTETGVVSWNVMEDAIGYNYVINGKDVLSTTALSVTLTNESTISVQSVYSSCVSEWSKPVTYFNVEDIYDVKEDEVYVKFHNTELDSYRLVTGSKIPKPVNPTKNNHTFDNWYSDPFYTEIFDFNREIYSDTIIYADFIPNDLIVDTYFWIKGDPKMSASIISGGSNSGWHFIPLKEVNTGSGFKEFAATVTIKGASSITPCAFIVMDGFDDGAGRTYWKNGQSDFSIVSDGVYTIYFSIEKPYQSGINVKWIKESLNISKEELLSTPIVYIDEVNNIAHWNSVSGATSYEVSIDNQPIINVTETQIAIEKGSFITVKAISDNKESRWSIPQANRNRINVDKDVSTNVNVYFVGYDSYQVELNQIVEAPTNPEKDDFIFSGWYSEPACINLVEFPYTVTCNTVFYPRWEYKDADYETKVYYNLVTETGGYIRGLTWNIDNYTFDEYETGVVKLEANTNYYIEKVSDPTVKYGPYKVNSSANYKIYFSEDNLWNGENVYIESLERTIYFTNNKRWTDTIYVYVFNSTTSKGMTTWPGIKMTFDSKNTYGEDIYKVVIDTYLYDSLVFSHGTMNGSSYSLSSQTIDIKFVDIIDNAYYVTEKNAAGKYQYGTWNK